MTADTRDEAIGNPRLVVLSGARQGTEMRLGEAPRVIGREPGTALTFAPDETLVSSTHASVTREGDTFVLRDAGSRNGTFVNGQRVTEKVLEEGDVISFGRGGPRAQFLVRERSSLPRTVTLPAVSAISGLYRAATERAREATTQGSPRTTMVMRQFASMAYERMSRRLLVSLAVLGVLVVGGLAFVYWQARAGAREQRAAIAMLDSALRVERAQRTATAAELSALRLEYQSLSEQQDAELAAIRGELGFAENAADAFGDGVALLVAAIGFLDAKADRPVRFVVGRDGQRALDSRRNPRVTLAGTGPEVTLEVTGTGFLVHQDGWMFTNRHVVDVTVDPQLTAIAEQLGVRVGTRLEMRRTALRAFFPGGDPRGQGVTVRRLSSEADVALLQLTGGRAPAPAIPLAAGDVTLRAGASVLLLGFPTGVDLLLARADERLRTSIVDAAGDDVMRLAGELARHRLVQPFLSTGRISDLTSTAVVFQGGTTHGSSGGPLIDSRGRVIAINYGGWSQAGDAFMTYRAVPIRFGWALLPPAVRSGMEEAR